LFLVQKKAFKHSNGCWMIHHILQATNSEDTWYLMPHITHDVKNMCVVQSLILKPPLNIGVWHLPQLFQNVPNHIPFHPHVRISSLYLDVVCLTFKYIIHFIKIVSCLPSTRDWKIQIHESNLKIVKGSKKISCNYV
jgi:hypothetical protein